MADLKRYNVLDEKYEDYDKESDIKYATMIKDFKIVLGTILSELYLLFLISGFSQKNIEGLFGFIVGLVLLVIVIVVFIEKLIKRKIGWKKIWDITKRLAILGVILAITLYICVTISGCKGVWSDCDFEINYCAQVDRQEINCMPVEILDITDDDMVEQAINTCAMIMNYSVGRKK